MPSSVSPPRGPRRRSPSPRRDRERDRDAGRDRPRDEGRSDHDRRDRDRDRDDRDRERGGDRHRDRDRDQPRERNHDRDADRDRDRDRDRPSTTNSRRTPSPPRRSKPKTKELSFYKKSSNSSSLGSFSHRRDPLDVVEESAKERMQRREQGEVPARFGGTREQGVRNTMSAIAPSGTSARGVGGGGDPLDRMPARGGGDGDKMMQERVAAMGGGAPAGGAAAGPPSGIPTPRNARMIEVIANDRMGRKVRVKCLPTDTVGDLKKLIAAQTGTTHQKIQLKKWYTVYKDHVSLRDYEINDGMSLEMY